MNMAARAIVLFLVLMTCSFKGATAHSAWSCPAARSADTGLKRAPCGGENEDNGGAWGSAGVTTIKPGTVRVSFVESIVHMGSPFRVALSTDGGNDEGFESCVLLDHIPHMDSFFEDENVPRPTLDDTGTWATYVFDIVIPDVKCDRCTLQLLYVMSDKSGKRCGFEPCEYDASQTECAPDAMNVPDAFIDTCKYTESDALPSCDGRRCFSNYHSCADVTITGVGDRASLVCEQPAGWAYSSLPPSKYFGNETAEWNILDSGNPPTFTWGPTSLSIADAKACPDYAAGPSPSPGDDSGDQKKKSSGVGGLVLGFIVLAVLCGVMFAFRKTLYEGFQPWLDSARTLFGGARRGVKLTAMT